MKNIPVLRFPEFLNDGEWEEKKLGEIATKNNLKNKNLEFANVLTNSAVDGIVNQRDYFDKDIANKNNLSGYYVVSKNDFIYNPRISSHAEVGSLKRNNLEKGIMSPLYMVFKFKEGNLSFFEHFFETKHWHNYMKSIANTGAKFDRLNIGNEQFFNLPIPFPISKEQQKITDCLSSVDNLITAQSKKVETLKEHKKALMQQLFPQDDEEVPKLRFPEFKNDWAVEELGKLGKFLGGGTPSKLVDEYWNGTIPWISSSDLNEDDLKTIAITRFINEKSILESATKLIPKGSVLFISRVGTGKLAINSVNLCTSQDFTNFIPTQIHNYFLGYYFLANKSALTSLDQGTSIKGFSKSDLEKIKLIYPKQKEEQQKIANFLSSIDELITASTKKVETLKEHKKALMQQLFPSKEVQQ
jgi:type I restriction enzyme S subunit